MRELKDKDQKLIISFVCVLIFTLSFYCFITNYKHFISLNRKITVSEIDNSYRSYKNNIINIENNLNNCNNKKTALYIQLADLLSVLKKDGVFRLIPGDKLGYEDLFKLNEYFIENIYNNLWLQGLKSNALVSDDLKKMVEVIIHSSTYLEQELLNNSDFFSQPQDALEKDVINKYHMILKNYDDFSYIMLKISNKLGDSK